MSKPLSHYLYPGKKSSTIDAQQVAEELRLLGEEVSALFEETRQVYREEMLRRAHSIIGDARKKVANVRIVQRENPNQRLIERITSTNQRFSGLRRRVGMLKRACQVVMDNENCEFVTEKQLFDFLVSGELDATPGVGRETKMVLIRYFQSTNELPLDFFDELEQASDELSISLLLRAFGGNRMEMEMFLVGLRAMLRNSGEPAAVITDQHLERLYLNRHLLHFDQAYKKPPYHINVKLQHLSAVGKYLRSLSMQNLV